MEERRIHQGDPDLKKLKRLYDRSFPRDERVPFNMLIEDLEEDRALYAYYEEETLIGLSYLFFHEDIAYLGYICIVEEYQGKGYGTRILHLLDEKYSEYRIVVDIEEVKEGKDREYRQKRKDFYLRNGYHSSGVYYRFFFVDYEILVSHGEITKEEWQSLIEKHWGKVAEKAVYK